MPIILEEIIKNILEENVDIQKYISNNENNPTYWAHFSNTSNLNSDKTSLWGITPSGLYVYPLISSIFPLQNLFAGRRKFIHIFSSNIGNITNLKDFTRSEYDRVKDQIIEKLLNLGLDTEVINKKLSKWETDKNVYNIDHIAAKFLNITKKASIILSGGDEEEWSPRDWTNLLLQLGYKALYDPGLSILYSSEPVQAVFFKNDFLKLEDVIDNSEFSEFSS